jgi:hypothetical protein
MQTRVTSDPTLSELFESATGIQSVKVDGIKTELAREMNSDSPNVEPRNPFKRGKEFAFSVMDGARIRASQDAEDFLSARGLGVRRLAYFNLPNLLIEQAVEANKSVRAADQATKSRRVGAIVRAAMRKIRTPYDAGFTWMRHVRFVADEDLQFHPDMHEVTPLDAWDDVCRRLVHYFGIVRDRQLARLSKSNLLRMLRRDPYFPRRITDAMVVDRLSSPKVISNERLMQLTLIAMGASPADAANVSYLFRSNANRFVFLSAHSGLSPADDVIRELDLSFQRIGEVVGHVDVLDSLLVQLFSLTSYTLSILSTVTGIPKHFKVMVGRYTKTRCLRSILGRDIVPEIEDFFGFHPELDFERDD